MDFDLGIFELETFILILLGTCIVGLIAILNVKSKFFKMSIILILCSTFLYSGYGIAYKNVNNIYLIKYFIYIITLVIPLVFIGKKSDKQSPTFSNFDLFFLKHFKFLKKMTIFYFVCLIIPLLYPDFRLFDIFIYGGGVTDNFYADRNMYNSNSFISLINMITIIILPFFYSYLVILTSSYNRKNFVAFLLLLVFLLSFMKYRYVGRNVMMTDLLQLFLIYFCIKKYTLKINKKQIIVCVSFFISLIPFLYAFTFMRHDEQVVSLTFFESVQALLISEVNYPLLYDHILNSHVLDYENGFTFILWIICLPIPSVLWPNKPRISSDSLTYSITGIRYTDDGYSSLLPSALGEGFQYFGEYFYWVHGLIVGLIFAIVIKYLSQFKILVFVLLTYVISALIYGRGGAASFIPPLINGSFPIYVINKFFLNKKRV